MSSIQRVRRHTRASLVAQTAIAGARFWNRAAWFKQQPFNRDPWIPPWALAEVARTSIIYGTDFGRTEATYADLLACFAAYHAYVDPGLKDNTADGLGGFFLRMGSEQLPMQQSQFRDLARSAALFVHTKPPPQHPPKVMTPGWDQELLGCSVIEYVAAASLLDTSASVAANWGRFDLNWLNMPHFAPMTDEVPADVLRRVIKTQYVATGVELRQRQQDVQSKVGPTSPQFRRFAFNPLTSRPVVAGLHDDLLIPAPALLIRKASPTGIYYEGLARWGSPFTTDLGHLFEAYIGRQLGQIDNAVLHLKSDTARRRTILASTGSSYSTTASYSSKPSRADQPNRSRLGAGDATAAVNNKIGHGVEQLNKAAKLIHNQTPGFEAIPKDRPILGLLATLDPFHNVNSPLAGNLLPQSDIPYVVCSASEIEQWAVLDDVSPGSALLGHFNDPTKRGWALFGALEGHEPHRNAVLDEGWRSYPWRGGELDDADIRTLPATAD